VAGRTLVIGYGNTLRGDDGAGPRVAAAAGARHDVHARAVHQLTPELTAALADVDVAVFVDARPSHPDGPVEVSALEPGGAGAPLAHGSDPRGLLALTEALHGRRPRGWLITVPAVSFDYGEELSATTARGVAQAVEIIADLAGAACRA
jgi:hydrogenase maturation protease